MPIREATLQETREWLGNGLVMPGLKRPPSSKNSSTESKQDKPQETMRQEPSDNPGFPSKNNPA
jgi:hypothetical protein